MKALLKTFILITLSAALSTQVNAQLGQATETNVFDSNTIPEELKKDAYSVKRKERIEVLVQNPGQATVKTYQVITVLNAKHIHKLDFGEYTSSFMSLEDAEIRLFNSNGKQITKLKKKDLMSQAAGSGLVPDGKYYFWEFSEKDLPITVETQTEVTYKGIFNLPEYLVQLPFEAVENSEMIYTYPADMKIAYKVYNADYKPQQLNNPSKGNSFSFAVRNLKSVKQEEYSGPWRRNFPYVIFNSDKFLYGGYPGNMSSWKEFGYWYFNGTKGLNELPENYKQQIREMVAGAKDDREKARIIYSYLQKNFRYVFIGLGIGGLIPFPASFVHEKKYGDCKGLSNYMQACLSAVNIKSHQVLINAGQSEIPVDPSFPHNGFDHVILLVPLAKDSVWLECTSNVNDFGHLGSFTENRNGLVITEQGGVLTKTPISKAKTNQDIMITKVQINEDGSGTITSSQQTTGDNKYSQVDLSKDKVDDQKYYLVNRLGFKNPDDYSISFGSPSQTPFVTQYTLDVEKIPDFIAGTKMFINPRMYKFWRVKIPNYENRSQEIYLDKPISKKDTTTFVLPEGYEVDVLPTARDLKFAYGSFSSKYWYDANSRTIYSTASLELNEVKIPPALYLETKLFMDKILEDENQKLVIKKM